MKKTLSILLALILTLTALTACGKKDSSVPGLYKELTGIDPDELAMTIDDHEISAEMYLYWVLFNCSAVEQQIVMFNSYYGLYDDLVDPVTHTVRWDGKINEDQTVEQYAIAMTEDTVKFMLAVEDVAKNMSPAAVSPQISQFIDLAVGYTQRFLGASDAALGDSRPDNAAAIIALQRAAATPMALSRQNLKESIEDLGRIYLDFMAADYGVRPVELRGEEGLVTVPMDFSLLRDIPLGVKLEAGTASYWSEIAAMQTLDNLLLQGKISTVEYLKRLPAGQISDRESLIAALEQEAGAQNDALGLGPGKEAQSLGTQEAE